MRSDGDAVHGRPQGARHRVLVRRLHLRLPALERPVHRVLEVLERRRPGHGLGVEPPGFSWLCLIMKISR